MSDAFDRDNLVFPSLSVQSRLKSSLASHMPRIRPLLWIALVAFFGIEITLLFKTSALTALNSDTVVNVLEVSDILHGNVLLHGWVLVENNSYLSDNPFFLLTRLLFGPALVATYAAPFLIYTLLISGAVGIVWVSVPEGWTRALALAAVVFYLGTPGLGGLANIVFIGNCHVAALTFCVLAWLAIDLAHHVATRRARLTLLGLYALCALIALMSDPFTIVVFLVPTLAGLCLALLAPNQKLFPIGLIGLTLTAFAGSRAALVAIRLAGGFTMVPGAALPQFVGAADLWRNAVGVLFGLLRVSDGWLFDRMLTDGTTVVALVRVAGLVLLLAATVVALRRGFRCLNGWNLRVVLAAAVLIDLGSCLMSHAFTAGLVPTALLLMGGSTTRYLGPAILFGGILASLELPNMLCRLRSRELRWALAGLSGVAITAAAGWFVVDGVTRWHEKPAIAQAPARVAARWLLDHGLTHGVGSYWAGTYLTVLSEQKLTVRAVLAVNGALQPFVYEGNQAWYRNQPRPQFVIYEPGSEFGIAEQAITATYGPPDAIEHVAGYDIAVLTPGR